MIVTLGTPALIEEAELLDEQTHTGDGGSGVIFLATRRAPRARGIWKTRSFDELPGVRRRQ